MFRLGKGEYCARSFMSLYSAFNPAAARKSAPLMTAPQDRERVQFQKHKPPTYKLLHISRPSGPRSKHALLYKETLVHRLTRPLRSENAKDRGCRPNYMGMGKVVRLFVVGG